MKLMILGHGRHGKDSVCNILKDQFGLTFQSSSKFCCDLFIYEALKTRYNYHSAQQCYEDRHNKRALWYDLICEYNKHDATRLGKQLFSEYDIYCGIRNVQEFRALQRCNAFDYCIWVDRSKILPQEPSSSISVDASMADYVIDNNGNLEQLKAKTMQLFDKLAYEHLAKYLTEYIDKSADSTAALQDICHLAFSLHQEHERKYDENTAYK